MGWLIIDKLTQYLILIDNDGLIIIYVQTDKLADF